MDQKHCRPGQGGCGGLRPGAGDSGASSRTSFLREALRWQRRARGGDIESRSTGVWWSSLPRPLVSSLPPPLGASGCLWVPPGNAEPDQRSGSAGSPPQHPARAHHPGNMGTPHPLQLRGQPLGALGSTTSLAPLAAGSTPSSAQPPEEPRGVLRPREGRWGLGKPSAGTRRTACPLPAPWTPRTHCENGRPGHKPATSPASPAGGAGSACGDGVCSHRPCPSSWGQSQVGQHSSLVWGLNATFSDHLQCQQVTPA